MGGLQEVESSKLQIICLQRISASVQASVPHTKILIMTYKPNKAND